MNTRPIGLQSPYSGAMKTQIRPYRTIIHNADVQPRFSGHGDGLLIRIWDVTKSVATMGGSAYSAANALKLQQTDPEPVDYIAKKQLLLAQDKMRKELERYYAEATNIKHVISEYQHRIEAFQKENVKLQKEIDTAVKARDYASGQEKDAERSEKVESLTKYISTRANTVDKNLQEIDRLKRQQEETSRMLEAYQQRLKECQLRAEELMAKNESAKFLSIATDMVSDRLETSALRHSLLARMEEANLTSKLDTKLKDEAKAAADLSSHPAEKTNRPAKAAIPTKRKPANIVELLEAKIQEQQEKVSLTNPSKKDEEKEKLNGVDPTAQAEGQAN